MKYMVNRPNYPGWSWALIDDNRRVVGDNGSINGKLMRIFSLHYLPKSVAVIPLGPVMYFYWGKMCECVFSNGSFAQFRPLFFLVGLLGLPENLARIPEHLAQWRMWLAPVVEFVNQELVRTLLVVFGVQVFVWPRPWSWLAKKDSTGRWTERTQLVPDWRISEAMDYVAKKLGSEIEQDVNAKYSEPAGLLTTMALAGEIQIWGKRLIAERKPELTQRKIASSEWNERELLIWACQPYTLKAQTRSVGQRAQQQFTDLYVNESQIKEIRWRGENAHKVSPNSDEQNDTPIYEAVDYVARKIDDCDSDKCYPSARRCLRKAAFEGRIKMHGKRELKKGYHSDLRTLIPPEFWDDQELNEMATSEAYMHHENTKAEMGTGFIKLGRDRAKYWDVRVSMDQVRKEWP